MALAGGAMRRARITALLVVLLASGCKCGQSSTPPLDLDGNVVAGDARIVGSDRAISDDAALDAELDAGLTPDSGPDSGGVPDSGPDSGVPPSCLVPAEATVTATEAIARAGALAGSVLDVRGTGETIAMQCLDPGGACDAGSCCRICTASVAIDRLLPLTASECFSAVPGCRGSECGVVCRPPVIGARQTFRGRLQAGADGGTAALQLLRVLQ